jgi:hypothetical protein
LKKTIRATVKGKKTVVGLQPGMGTLLLGSPSGLPACGAVYTCSYHVCGHLKPGKALESRHYYGKKQNMLAVKQKETGGEELY